MIRMVQRRFFKRRNFNEYALKRSKVKPFSSLVCIDVTRAYNITKKTGRADRYGQEDCLNEGFLIGAITLDGANIKGVRL